MEVVSVGARIELSIPARAELLQLARMAAGFAASQADLGLDELEDLRLAVDELCLTLLGSAGGQSSRLSLEFDWDDDMIEVTCWLAADRATTRDGAGEPMVEPDWSHVEPGRTSEDWNEGLRQAISTHLLDALVDEHGLTADDERPGAWLRMRVNKPDRAEPGS
jgi:hypothetical protein